MGKKLWEKKVKKPQNKPALATKLPPDAVAVGPKREIPARSLPGECAT